MKIIQHPRRVIRLAQLASTSERAGLLPVGPATIWRWVRTQPEFPKPFRLGPGVTCWDLDAIEEFIRQQQASV